MQKLKVLTIYRNAGVLAEHNFVVVYAVRKPICCTILSAAVLIFSDRFADVHDYFLLSLRLSSFDMAETHCLMNSVIFLFSSLLIC
jgi:hypothetical protein